MTCALKISPDGESDSHSGLSKDTILLWSTISDGELLRAISQGDRAAFGELYQRFVASMVGIAQRILDAREDAEDVVHDVFLEVWRRAADYDPRRGSVAAWLLVRTRSRALDRLKSPGRKRRISWEEAGHFDDEESFVAKNVDNEIRDPGVDFDCAEVWLAVDKLPPDQRAIIELAYGEGLTLVEVGVCLGAPEGTIKSRLARAMNRLRAFFSLDEIARNDQS